MTRGRARDDIDRRLTRPRPTAWLLPAIAAWLGIFACDDREVSLGADPLVDTPPPPEERDAGVPVDDAGSDAGVRACGSRGLAPCANGEFCRFPLAATCGQSNAPGVCTTIPVNCPFERDAVCGCNGQTYPNECEAHEDGTSVASLGACPEPQDEPCEPRNGFQCPPGKFCEPTSGECWTSGECRERPTSCTREARPVCGCDGWPYPNRCFAHFNGMPVRNEGQCSSGGSSGGDPSSYLPCGGAAATVCPPDEFCDYRLGDGCDVPDPAGRCRERVSASICPSFSMPVCGCDGTTYDNLCFADAAMMSVDFAGECP